MIHDGINPGLIKKQELFSSLSDDEIKYVISESEVLCLPKNGRLFSAGEKAVRFYILLEGEIRVYKLNSGGIEEDMARFAAEDTIGDFDFARGAEYDAYAEAAADSRLAVFPKTDMSMDSLSNKEPGIVCGILLNAIIMMTARIKYTNKLVLENLSWVQDLHRRAYEDAGTGLWKQTLIADEIAAGLKDPSALIMCKPDRFKILVDSRGHAAGDEAMVKIALILKNIARSVSSKTVISKLRDIGHGWPMRFKSNETGLIFNNCAASQAEEIAKIISEKISAMEPVPAEGENKEFRFSATISWCIWPMDNDNWNNLFQGNYANLLDTWKSRGNTVAHYTG